MNTFFMSLIIALTIHLDNSILMNIDQKVTEVIFHE